MALAAEAFLMRSCDAPADTVRSASASAMKPTEEGRSWLLWKRAGWGVGGASQVWLTQVLQDGLPFVSDFSAGVSHGFNVNAQTAIPLKKKA